MIYLCLCIVYVYFEILTLLQTHDILYFHSIFDTLHLKLSDHFYPVAM